MHPHSVSTSVGSLDSLSLGREDLELEPGTLKKTTYRRGLWCPVGRADFSMGLHKLERLHQTEGFFHTAAHWEVVDTQVFDDTIRVNNEEASAQNLS